MIDLLRFLGLLIFGGGLAWLTWLLIRWSNDE